MSAVYEKEKLAYRLLEGESAKRLERPGASLRYSVLPCAGDKVGTVIFLHGVASNGSRWEEFIEKTSLKQAFDILRCDLRGHAASVSSRQARLEDWCGDVAAILQAEGVAKAVVVGHSLGAQVAVNLAAKYDDCVLGGVLLDPLISEALTPKALEMRAKLPYLKIMERFCRLGNALGFSRRLKNQDLRAMDAKAREKIAAGGKELEEFIKQYSSARADLKYIHSAVYLHDLVEVGRPTPAPESISVPMLVIGASAGTFTDADAMRRWVNSLKDGQIAVVKCAHWPLTECPRDVASVIEGWVFKRFAPQLAMQTTSA